MPSTRFIFNTTKTIPGQTIQLKHKGIWLSKSASTTITGHIMRARAMLSTTIAALSSGLSRKDKAFASTYFITGPNGPTPVQLLGIQTKLQLTYGGLSSDLSLKLGGDGAHGFVVERNNGFGTLHVSKKTLLSSEQLGIITLIHEATHKFAGTEDGDAGVSGKDSEEMGYREEDDTDWWRPGLTTDLALNNADSLAYFTYRVGEAHGI
jgi:hypothetical protein